MFFTSHIKPEVFSETQLAQNPLAHFLHEHSMVFFELFRFILPGKHHRPHISHRRCIASHRRTADRQGTDEGLKT